MNYWLIKSEPDEYSIDDLKNDGSSPWTGVRNYQARNFMRDGMRPGDLVLFYHSSTIPPGVSGLARVASEPYPDPTAFDPKSEYFDPKSSISNPTWMLVDFQFVEKFPTYITLEEIKSSPELQSMRVAQRGSRLSVQPVEKQHFELILERARAH
jgi:predicted RNA-binding protein with PUA-like domain